MRDNVLRIINTPFIVVEMNKNKSEETKYKTKFNSFRGLQTRAE